MKRKWLCGVLVSVLLISAGCGKDAAPEATEVIEDSPIIIDSETIGVTDGADDSAQATESHIMYDFNAPIRSVFPLEEGYMWLYIGTAEYASVEVISKIDRQHPEVTDLYIEGLIEDMSGEFLSDTSYLKTYSIFDQQLIRKFGPYESVVLKSPAKKGDSWENLYFDSVYGLFDAHYEVKEATNTMVVVGITPVSPAKDGVPKQFKLDTTYEVGKGVTVENRVYVFDDNGVEDTFDFSSALYEEATLDKNSFVSRYFSKNPYISSIYNKGYFDYAIKEVTAYQYLEKNKFRLTDDLMVSGYQDLIASLDQEDIRTVSVAENVLHIYAEKMDNPERLIGSFIDYYEKVIQNNAFILIDWFGEGELESVSVYDVETGEYSIPIDVVYLDDSLQAKVSLMNDNGIGYYFSNGKPVIKPSSTYLTNNLYYLSDIPMQSYLTLLKQAYEKKPYVRDGISTLTLDELQAFILGFDKFEQSYGEGYIGESSRKWCKTFFMQYLKPSSMLYEIGEKPGRLHDSSLVHYKMTLQKIKDPELSAVLSRVIDLLEKNDNKYSTELGKLLSDYGVEVMPKYLED